jgi:hypothetical protein
VHLGISRCAWHRQVRLASPGAPDAYVISQGAPERQILNHWWAGGEEGRAQIRRLHPGEAARPALMRRAAHAVGSKAVVRIEVAASPGGFFSVTFI